MTLPTINPYILLGIGCFFSLLYAGVIIFGWARTRQARRAIQEATDMVRLPLYDIDKEQVIAEQTARCISLTHNQFTDSCETPINISEFEAYIAASESTRYPEIRIGNLLLFNKETGKLMYAFPLPPLENYR